MNTKISDLTIDELKDLISKTVQDVMEEYLEDLKALSSKDIDPGKHEEKEWVTSSLSQLNKIYSEDEPEYSASLIKEPNPEYKI